MPLIKLNTNVEIQEDQKNVIISKLSKLIANEIGKPEQYVMAIIDRADMLMSGGAGDAAFVEVKSIGGLSAQINTRFSQKICQLLDSELGISPVRVYINFEDVNRDSWGWNSKTF